MFRILLALCLLHPVLGYPYTQTIDAGPGIGVFFNRPFSVPFTFTDISPPPATGQLTVSAFGDINNIVETVEVYSRGVLLGSLFDDQFYAQDPIALTDFVTVPVPIIARSIAGGSLTFNMVVPSDSATSQVRFDSLTLTYQVPGHGLGLNQNAIAAVPEPSTWALMLSGLGLLGFIARRRKLH